jgi:hypothetical protein
MLRVMRYDYKFTDRKTLKETGQWWTRTPKGLYIPFVLMNKDALQEDQHEQQI